jgi:hypothetical protein
MRFSHVFWIFVCVLQLASIASATSLSDAVVIGPLTLSYTGSSSDGQVFATAEFLTPDLITEVDSFFYTDVQNTARWHYLITVYGDVGDKTSSESVHHITRLQTPAVFLSEQTALDGNVFGSNQVSAMLILSPASIDNASLTYQEETSPGTGKDSLFVRLSFDGLFQDPAAGAIFVLPEPTLVIVPLTFAVFLAFSRRNRR